MRLLGKEFNGKYGEFKVVDKIKVGRYLVKFKEYNGVSYVTEANASSIKKLTLRNPYYPHINGVGYMGSYNKGTKATRLYDIWIHILGRCYNENHYNYKFYGGRGVRVHKDWHCYNTFYNDVQALEGWEDGLMYKGYRELDKDKYSSDNKLYSIDTCCWISRIENNRLIVK